MQLKDDSKILNNLIKITQYAKAYTEGNLPSEINESDLDATDLIDFDNLPEAFEEKIFPDVYEANYRGILIRIQKVFAGEISEIYFDTENRHLEIRHTNGIKSTPVIEIEFPADWQVYYDRLYDKIY